ncbi:MAG: hypothetical protein WB816_13440 [Methylocystis sp.]
MYKRALALILALMAIHGAWSALNASELTTLSSAAMGKIPSVTPARMVGLRPASRNSPRDIAGGEASEPPSGEFEISASRTP